MVASAKEDYCQNHAIHEVLVPTIILAPQGHILDHEGLKNGKFYRFFLSAFVSLLLSKIFRMHCSCSNILVATVSSKQQHLRLICTIKKEHRTVLLL